METGDRSAYPGEKATTDDLRRLADEYRGAAHILLSLSRPGEPLSRAPFRLSAIQAIELYLNALLLHLGYEHSQIRGLNHDLAERADLASQGGLRLRQRTLTHIRHLVRDREYLVTRYGPEMCGTVSEINRLVATLDEVAAKTSSAFKTGRTGKPGD